MRSVGLRLDLIILIVLSNFAIPSSAKNSHCTGIITELEADNALSVIFDKDGGQSIIIK